MFNDTVKLKEWLRESALHFDKTKAFAKKARDYYNGDQLDSTIKLILANRGQPEQYENQIAKHNNSILGQKDDRDIEIKLFGRQQSDRASADMLNALIKAITQVSDYENESKAMDDELSLEGVAIAELTVDAVGEFDRFNREHKDLVVNQVPSHETFLDPFSKSKNYNDDARYLHRAFWIDIDDLYTLGFDAKLIEQLTNNNYLADIVDEDLSADETIRQRALLCYTWYRKLNKVTNKDEYFFCFWSDETILLQNISPYMFKGFPYEVEFLNRDFTGEIKYWGLYRDIMPIQDHINYSKLRLQNMLANNKTLVNKGAIVDEDIVQFNEEFSMDDATVMVEDINGIKEIKQNVQIQQILNVIIDGRNQISELLNTNKELLGSANNRMSGVGQEQRIKTGLVGMSKFIGHCDNLQKKIVKKAVRFITQYYDSERVVSIIDEDYMQNYITMNETQVNEYGNVDFERLEDGRVKPMAKNTLQIGKFDLIYSAKPKSTSMSSERLKQNIELLKVLQSTDPSLVKYLVPDILKDSDSPSAKKMRDIIAQQDEQQSNSPQAQLQAQLNEANEKLAMMHKQSQINLNNSKAKALTDKNQIDLQKAFSNSVIAKENIKVKQQNNIKRVS